jgi:hypothetical protein
MAINDLDQAVLRVVVDVLGEGEGSAGLVCDDDEDGERDGDDECSGYDSFHHAASTLLDP